MQHLDDGALRRALDDPWSLTDEATTHLETCHTCAARKSAIAADAADVAAALDATVPDADVDAAYARFASGRGSSGRTASLGASPVFPARRYLVPVAAGIAAVAAVLLLAFTPVGTVAQNFLTVFEPHQFVAVPVTRAQLEVLPDLRSFGTVVQQVQPEHREAATSGQASALTGLPVRMPSWVPAGVPRPMHIVAVSRGVGTFTFSAAKARAFAIKSRKSIPPMPRDLDRSTLTLQVGPMVVVAFGPMPDEGRQSAEDDDRAMPPLTIVQAAAPRVTSTGANAREIEDYLLAMPGVAPQLAAEIRAIGDPDTTMPVPVPVDKAFAQDVAIDGVRGLGIGDETGVGGIIVWQKNGIVYGVGGTLPQSALLQVARSLR